MTLDAARLRAAVRSIHPGALPAADAECIVELLQMAVDADEQEDAAEIKLFFEIGTIVYELAGLRESPSPSFSADDEDERLSALTVRLAPSSRELAYAVTHLMTVIDIEISPAEDGFLAKLRAALQLDDDRADELAAQVGAAITPE